MSHYSIWIRVIKCVSTEDGVDTNSLEAFANVARLWAEAGSHILGAIPDARAKALSGVAALEAKLAAALPNLVSAIDHDRNDPDQLYIAVGNEPGTSMWPKVGAASDNNYEIRTDGIWTGDFKLLPINLSANRDMSFSLWEYDTGSPDDFLGSFIVRPAEIGKRVAKLVVGHVEKSAYIIEYEVRPETSAGNPMLVAIFNKVIG